LRKQYNIKITGEKEMDLSKLGQLGSLAQGQDQFLKYITERVHDEHNDTAKELLKQDFAKLKSGSLTHDDVKNTQETLMKLVKPEDIEAVKTAMSHFTSQMNNNKTNESEGK